MLATTFPQEGQGLKNKKLDAIFYASIVVVCQESKW